MSKKNIFLLLGNKKKSSLYIYFFSSFLAIFFEMLGLGSVPVIALVITEPQIIISKIYSFTDIDLNFLDKNQLVIYSCIIFFVIFLTKNLVLTLISYLQAYIVRMYRQNTTNLVYEKFIFSNYQFFINNNPSLLIRKINADIGNAFTYFFSILQLTRESILVIFILIFLISIDPAIYTITFSLFFIITLVIRLIYKKILSDKGSILLKEGSNKLQILNQSFYSIKEIKIMGKEQHFLKKFIENTRILENISFINTFITSLPRLIFETLTILVIVFFTSILVLFNKPDEFIIPIISLLVAAGSRFIPSFNIINNSFSGIKLFKDSYLSVLDTITKDDKENTFTNKVKNRNEKVKFDQKIEIKDLNFAYNSKKILSNINMTINKGETVGIIGLSGAGKTTLINIFLGLLKSESGYISVDGKNINENLKSWQTSIGYVAQDVHLIDDTILNNICFGQNKTEINNLRFKEAVKNAQLLNFINSLSEKEMTKIGNAGARISGGQRQRIAIARALYLNPKIMVLDESTSSLDIDSEKKIIDEVNSQKDQKTIIVISHRKNALIHCDKIFLIENGEIKKQLTYNELENINYKI
mgnify:CR=1 FL=1|tara:strand:- start:5807 stop:7564 length:1758 start_codon:yes stop_codon:yes gene_type:complete